MSRIDAAGGLAAFADRPDHERLAAAHVAAGEDARHAGACSLVGLDVAALVELQAELGDDAVGLGTDENPSPAARGPPARSSRCRAPPSSAAGRRCGDPFDVHRLQPGHPARLAEELLGQDAPEPLAAFLVRAAGAQLHRPVRPGLVGRAGPPAAWAAARTGSRSCAPWRLEVPTQSRAGVAAADDDHVLAGGEDVARAVG